MNKKNKKLAKKVKNKIIKSKTDDKIARLKSNLNIENVVSSKKLKVSMITAVVLLILLIKNRIKFIIKHLNTLRKLFRLYIVIHYEIINQHHFRKNFTSFPKKKSRKKEKLKSFSFSNQIIPF